MEIPDILLPVLDKLEAIEREIFESTYDNYGGNSPINVGTHWEFDIGAIIARSFKQGGLEGAVNIIPEQYGVPGHCHEVLVVVVLASRTSATGNISLKDAGVKDLEGIIMEARRHLNRCPQTEAIVFWPISSWHPFVWLGYRHLFGGVHVALRMPGSETIMI